MEEQISLRENEQLKNTKKSFILFMIGEVLLIVGMLSSGANYKFFPRWIENFVFFAFVGYILIIIALCYIRKIHVSFNRSLIAVAIMLVASFVGEICKTSSDSFNILLGRGLTWSADLLSCVGHIYFLQGCIYIFKEFKDEKMAKYGVRVAIAYFAIFATFVFFKAGSRMDVVLSKTIPNRIFVYGSMLFEFLSYIYIVVCIVFISIKVSLLRKEGEHVGENQTDEVREVQELL